MREHMEPHDKDDLTYDGEYDLERHLNGVHNRRLNDLMGMDWDQKMALHALDHGPDESLRDDLINAIAGSAGGHPVEIRPTDAADEVLTLLSKKGII